MINNNNLYTSISEQYQDLLNRRVNDTNYSFENEKLNLLKAQVEDAFNNLKDMFDCLGQLYSGSSEYYNLKNNILNKLIKTSDSINKRDLKILKLFRKNILKHILDISIEEENSNEIQSIENMFAYIDNKIVLVNKSMENIIFESNQSYLNRLEKSGEIANKIRKYTSKTLVIKDLLEGNLSYFENIIDSELNENELEVFLEKITVISSLIKLNSLPQKFIGILLELSKEIMMRSLSVSAEQYPEILMILKWTQVLELLAAIVTSEQLELTESDIGIIRDIYTASVLCSEKNRSILVCKQDDIENKNWIPRDVNYFSYKKNTVALESGFIDQNIVDSIEAKLKSFLIDSGTALYDDILVQLESGKITLYDLDYNTLMDIAPFLRAVQLNGDNPRYTLSRSQVTNFISACTNLEGLCLFSIPIEVVPSKSYEYLILQKMNHLKTIHNISVSQAYIRNCSRLKSVVINALESHYKYSLFESAFNLQLEKVTLNGFYQIALTHQYNQIELDILMMENLEVLEFNVVPRINMSEQLHFDLSNRYNSGHLDMYMVPCVKDSPDIIGIDIKDIKESLENILYKLDITYDSLLPFPEVVLYEDGIESIAVDAGGIRKYLLDSIFYEFVEKENAKHILFIELDGFKLPSLFSMDHHILSISECILDAIGRLLSVAWLDKCCIGGRFHSAFFVALLNDLQIRENGHIDIESPIYYNLTYINLLAAIGYIPSQVASSTLKICQSDNSVPLSNLLSNEEKIYLRYFFAAHSSEKFYSGDINPFFSDGEEISEVEFSSLIDEHKSYLYDYIYQIIQEFLKSSHNESRFTADEIKLCSLAINCITAGFEKELVNHGVLIEDLINLTADEIDQLIQGSDSREGFLDSCAFYASERNVLYDPQLNNFFPEELELMNNTIEWIKNLSDEDYQSFIQASTSSSRFNPSDPLTICLLPDSTKIPTANTCFNKFYVPMNNTKEMLEIKLNIFLIEYKNNPRFELV